MFRKMAVMAALSLAGVATAAPGLVDYPVRPGDSCWSIAERFFGKGSLYKTVHRYNNLGPMPHVLSKGQILRLPRSATTPDANLVWLVREVRARGPSDALWRHAKRGMQLWRQYRVSTGDDAATAVAFADGSKLRVGDNALLVLYGTAHQTIQRLRQPRLTTVSLERGAVSGGLARLDQEALRIKTVASDVRLRSRNSHIAVDDQQSATISVFDGKADVRAQGAKVTLESGFGTTVAKGERPQPPRALPATPAWTGGKARLYLVPAGGQAPLKVAWRRVRGASKYRIQLWRGKGDDARLLATRLAGRRQRAAFIATLAKGKYWAQIAALDRNGLKSAASKPLQVTVAAWQTTGALHIAADGVMEAAGVVRLTLPAGLRQDCRLSLDGAAEIQGRQPVRIWAPGTHGIRVRCGSSRVFESQVRLLDINAVLRAVPRQVNSGSHVTATLETYDSQERPVMLPEVMLEAFPIGQWSMSPIGPGRYSVRFWVPGGNLPPVLRVMARWAGGHLQTVGLRVNKSIRGAEPATKVTNIGKLYTPAQARARLQAAAATLRGADPKRLDQVALANPDPDGDGLGDKQDKCPLAREDVDRFEDEDGCPDPDNDGDGVADAVDRCPMRPETVNGVKDEDGCPDQGAARVSVGSQKLEIAEVIRFEPNGAAIVADSEPLLKEIAATIKAHAHFKVQIEGHTDGWGNPERNVDLSERRAQAVMLFLIEQGVPAQQLSAKGYGPKQPVASNRRREGRALNRRVVFRIAKR